MEGWLTIFGWLFSVVTSIGNGFVIGVVAKNRRLHSPANWLVVSLAIADLGVGIVIFPSSYVCINMLPCNGRVHMGAFWFFVHSSVTNLCILTWDRYTAIVHPFKYITSIPARHPKRIILIAWLIPLMISLTLVLGMYATSSLTVMKFLRLTGVSLFDILTCALLLYAVVRIVAVVRAQSLQDSAMKSLKRDLVVSLQLQAQEIQTSIEAAAPRGGKKFNSSRFIIAIVVFFLGCHIATKLSNSAHHVCFRCV